MAPRLPAVVLIALLGALTVAPGAHAARSRRAHPAPIPHFATNVVAVPTGGTVTVKGRGKRAATRLRHATIVGFGATIDATKGTVRLVAATSSRGHATWEAKADGGAFTIAQSKASKGEVELRLAGGGLTCRAPYGNAKASRTLRVRTSGRFTTRTCFGRVRLKTPARAATASAAAASPTWTVVEYPNGWRIRYVGPLLLEVTDLKTGKVQLVKSRFLYDYVYSRRPLLPPTTPIAPIPGVTQDPLGDLLPCPYQGPCTEVDLKSASAAGAGGQVTFTVEGFAPFTDLASYPVVEVWTTKPTSGAAHDYDLDPCAGAGCPGPVRITHFLGGPPYAEGTSGGSIGQPSPNVFTLTVPLSALGGATSFHWITASFACGFVDRIPDTGTIAYPSAGAAGLRPRRPIATAAC